MSISYEINKCKYISFVKDIKHINDAYLINPLYVGFNDDSLNEIIKQIIQIQNHFTLVINTESNLFNDIIFEVNEEHLGESSKKGKKTQDVNRDVLLGGSQQLEAFSNSKFTIIPGKRSANIQSCHPKQNHDIIDSIARNGLMISPKVSTEHSVGKLFNVLCLKQSFNIIMVNKYLEVSIRESKYPNDYVEPAYIIGKGEIVTVFYRFICLYFFGYCSVTTTEDRDRNYDI